MREILARIIMDILKKAGFELVNKIALEQLIEVLNDKVFSTLNIISQQSILAGRSSVSLLDVFGINQKNRYLANLLNNENNTIENMFNVIPITDFDFPIELLPEENKWISPISTKFEKFIHIYDFMPDFPPIHTFRQTFTKNQISKNQSSKVKNRLEQSLKTEDNMIKLIKSSGSIPKFVNFMYKNKRV